jgi:hypothetical protein
MPHKLSLVLGVLVTLSVVVPAAAASNWLTRASSGLPNYATAALPKE